MRLEIPAKELSRRLDCFVRILTCIYSVHNSVRALYVSKQMEAIEDS